MADKPPTRNVILKFWGHAVALTEAEIEEHKVLGLFVRDAGPEDKLAPHAVIEAQRAASAAALVGTTPAPAGPAAAAGAGVAAKPKDQ